MDQELIRRFRRLSNRYMGAIMHHAQAGELRPGEAMVMDALAKRPGDTVTPSRISEVLGVRPPTVTPLLDRMERKGLIIREPSSQDRRVIRILATNKGLAAEKKHRQSVEVFYEELSHRMSREELKEFLRLLDKITSPDTDIPPREELL